LVSLQVAGVVELAVPLVGEQQTTAVDVHSVTFVSKSRGPGGCHGHKASQNNDVHVAGEALRLSDTADLQKSEFNSRMVSLYTEFSC